MKKQKGVTLIELVIFIIVLGIIVTGILMSFGVALRKSPDIDRASRAVELAQQRMDLIVGLRKMNGFDSITTDPCEDPSPPNACTIPSGYTITTTIGDGDNPWVAPDYKVVTITVKDSSTDAQLAQIKALLAAYS
jgi:type II secretory pathway pseudopilin PulG